MHIFIPIELDLDKLIEEFPPEGIKSFNKDKLAYLISIRSYNISSYYIGPEPSARTMKAVVDNYKEYIDYLLRTKVLFKSGGYLPGEYSTSYSLNSSKFKSKEKKPYRLTHYTLIKNLRIKKDFKFKEQSRTFHIEHLSRFFNKNLQVDIDKIDQSDYEFDEPIIEWSTNQELEATIPIKARRYNEINYALHAIVDHLFNLIRDITVGRLYTPLTMINKKLRKHVTYKGKRLVGIDMKNCQPFLSLGLLNPRFWKENEKHPLNIHNLFQLDFLKNTTPFTYPYSSSFLPNMLGESEHSLDYKEIEEYTHLVSEGKFYEYFEDKIHKSFDTPELKREWIKKHTLKLLNAHNSYRSELKTAFIDTFPTISAFFAKIKETDYKYFSRILMRIESFIFIDYLTRIINKLHPRIPLFTIHDNIITTEANLDIVKQIVVNESEEVFGVKPSFGVESW